MVTVLDGHSHALGWLGTVLGVPHVPLGVDAFGQSGARADLYRHYGIDAGSRSPGPRASSSHSGAAPCPSRDA